MNLKSALRRLLYFVQPRRAYKFLLAEFFQTEDLDSLAELLASTRHLRTIDPIEMNGPRSGRVLVIAPHEDDEMIGPGGTVIKLRHAGARVRVLYLTAKDGELGRTRRRETIAVSEKIGYETEFLDHPAGTSFRAEETAQILAERINAFEPNTLLLPFLSDDHPEHRAASEILSAAAARSLIRGSPEVWAYQVYSALLANVIVNISNVADEKRDAIRMWKDSAMQSRDWAHYALGLNAYNCRLVRGANDPLFIEAFFVVPFDEYIDICGRYFTS
jgi:N-acetylglucosamine malate deacetylase 1